MSKPNYIFDGFIDIETLPTDDELLIAEIDAEIAPPKTHKRAETIAAWMKEEKPALLTELVARTALDGTYGRILGIGCALDAGPVTIWMGDDEAKVLREAFARIADIEKVQYPGAGDYTAEITWVGHNVRGFDLRFLYQRACVHGIRMPRTLREAASARPWESRLVADTMTMWHPDRDRRISLAKLCRALKVASPKHDMDGSKVAAAWKAGEFDRIEAYIRDDVEAVRRCYRRMTFAEVT